MSSQKVKLAQIPVANDRIYGEIAKINRMNKGDVETMVIHLGQFIAKTITNGQMQGVMIPYFGKFQPKPRYINNKKRIHRMLDNGTFGLHKALKGEPLKDSEYEILHDQHGQGTGTEQGMDIPGTGVCSDSETGQGRQEGLPRGQEAAGD